MVVLLVKEIEESFNCAVISYIALDCKYFSLVFGKAFDKIGGRLSIGGIEGIDAGPCLKKTLGDGGANAACSARDDGYSIGEVVGDHGVD